ncbi:unnamed protein product [Menidia menidia]|uniref:(Atlantic silverside) hypothetical protein n=1 Tax=Menidia menidia TaxID=238744 RepID=A0A8S4AWW1_9TELE|nr:unnamed protein product [Menidia menidia]
MDWFHCNQCFRKQGSKFAVSSCGHICCETCIKPNQCSICGASCSYLAISDEVGESHVLTTGSCAHSTYEQLYLHPCLFQMKPQEKVFFKDPVKVIESRLAHISQVGPQSSTNPKLPLL